MEQAVTGVLSFAAGVFTGVVTPWVKWLVERRRIRHAHRIELVAKWRAMVQRAVLTRDEDESGDRPRVIDILEREKDFYSLRHHLSPAAKHQLARTTVGIAGSSIDAPLSYILDDIATLEEKWDLV